MNGTTRCLLFVTFASVGVLPLLTGHALIEQGPHLHPDVLSSALEHPDVAVLLLLTALALVPLFRMVAVAVRLLRASRQLRAVVAGGSGCRFRDIEYVRIAAGDVIFFTAGFRKPTIYVSEGAEALPADQFHAALLHERAHAERHDVRWLALLAALDQALAFIPWSKRAFSSLRLLMERRADEDAVAAGASRLDLFDAIVIASTPSVPSGAALSEVGTLQRLQWLAEPRLECAGETRAATVLLASVMIPPVLAHALLWIGLLCAICSAHVI